MTLRDLAAALKQINELRHGDLSSLQVRTLPNTPADWITRAIVGPRVVAQARGDATFSERFAFPGFATGGVVTRDMLAAVHKGEVVIPPGGGGDILKKPIKEGTEEGTRKGVLEGMRDWFDEPRSVGGGRGGGGGGRLAALGGGGAGEVPSAGGGLGSPHGGGGGKRRRPADVRRRCTRLQERGRRRRGERSARRRHVRERRRRAPRRGAIGIRV